ncbi:hypothetical protein SAMN05444411_1331 [Lutibacter oricola]|uniref:Uncharacterized protein n=2 Tax=Lutibacter oricola TaxID=762486 RepID=A0A1H3HBT9_9FLAO|nr:hypothetical protein SAMN05444411_1331 [Lutibacter oricola]
MQKPKHNFGYSNPLYPIPIMKKSILLILILLFNSNLFSQSNLEPTNDLDENYQGVLKDYFENIFPLLFDSLSNKPLARFTAMPSFSYENTLSVEKDSLEEYKMIFHRCSESYWYAERKSKVKIIKDSITIDSEFAQLIEELFKKSVYNSKKPENEIIGFDGEFYYFTILNNNDNLSTGMCWSPNKNSRIGKLVEIGQILIDLTTKKSKDFNTTKLRIEELIKEFD